MKYKIGQVVLSRSNGIYSRLISIWNMVKWKEPGYTHAGIVVGEDSEFVYIAESIGYLEDVKAGGVSIYPYEKWWLEARLKEATYIIGESKIPLNQDKVLQMANLFVGTGYGWLDIMRIFLVPFLSLKEDLIKDYTGTKALICSEAVGRILSSASSGKIRFPVTLDLVEPMHIYKNKEMRWKEYG